jgi:plasmid stabilization system protein ParE
MEKCVAVDWSDNAIDDLQNIHDFIAQYSKNRAQKIVERVFERITILESGFVRIGQVEELLQDTEFEYRYLVEDVYKIIYRLVESRVEIVKIFDVRQNPEKLKQDIVNQ